VELDKANARLSTLQGKYNAEPGRLAAENSALVREIAALKEQVGRLAAGGSTPPADGTSSVQAPGPAGSNPFGKWFEDTYGPEHRAEFDGYIQEQIKAGVGDIRREVSAVSTATAQTASERYYGALDGMVPEWETARDDPRFVPFLKERIPGTNLTRFDAAKAAEDGRDANTVAEHYLEFIKRFPDVAKEPAVHREGTPPSKARSGKEALVAPRTTPGGAGSGPKDTKNEVPWVKASDIQRLAVEKATTNRWKGKETEYAAIKATHNAAISANRVLADQ
jgi:hypothetical protein